MYLTTDEIEKLLASERKLELLPHRFWLATMLDRAHAAGRNDGIEIGRNQAASERVCGRQSTGISEAGGEIVAKD